MPELPKYASKRWVFIYLLLFLAGDGVAIYLSTQMPGSKSVLSIVVYIALGILFTNCVSLAALVRTYHEAINKIYKELGTTPPQPPKLRLVKPDIKI